MKVLDAVKEYQCTGCINGPALMCYKKDDAGSGCESHFPATYIAPFPGLILLGMPKGFNRVGPLQFSSKRDDITKIIIYEKWEDAGYFYNEWNVPVWKFLDSFGNTIVRGMHPRNNMPFIHIYIGNHLDKIQCFEVSKELQQGMD